MPVQRPIILLQFNFCQIRTGFCLYVSEISTFRYRIFSTNNLIYSFLFQEIILKRAADMVETIYATQGMSFIPPSPTPGNLMGMRQVGGSQSNYGAPLSPYYPNSNLLPPARGGVQQRPDMMNNDGSFMDSSTDDVFAEGEVIINENFNIQDLLLYYFIIIFFALRIKKRRYKKITRSVFGTLSNIYERDFYKLVNY